MTKSVIISTGSYTPKKILTNEDLSKMVDTSDEWIFTRTGIKQRHIAAKDETTSQMAIHAAKDAIEKAKISKSDIDLIVVSTTTPDKTFPATAAKVQAGLGIKNAAVFDLQAVCSGFVYGITVVDSLIKSGLFNTALLIGADKMSSIVDWKDRNTCVLFGDAAGACILSNKGEGRGIIASDLAADGCLENILHTSGGTSTTQNSGFVHMEGREVFKHAVQKMCSSIKKVLKKEDLKISDIDWLVPHQANVRIIDLIAEKLSIPKEKSVLDLENHANTSAATIPVALNSYSDRFKKGDKIVLTAAGGGFTWGSVLLEW